MEHDKEKEKVFLHTSYQLQCTQLEQFSRRVLYVGHTQLLAHAISHKFTSSKNISYLCQIPFLIQSF